MPLRSRSSASSSSITCLASRARRRVASRSASTPSRIVPPFSRSRGGASASTRASSSRRLSQVGVARSQRPREAASSRKPSSSSRAGRRVAWARPSRRFASSGGVARPRATRPRRRSKSGRPLSRVSTGARRPSSVSHSTWRQRASSASRSRSGWSSQSRSRREPMRVRQASSRARRLPALEPSSELAKTSRCRALVASSSGPVAPSSSDTPWRWAGLPFCVRSTSSSSAASAPSAAGWGSRPTPSRCFQPKKLSTCCRARDASKRHCGRRVTGASGKGEAASSARISSFGARRSSVAASASSPSPGSTRSWPEASWSRARPHRGPMRCSAQSQRASSSNQVPGVMMRMMARGRMPFTSSGLAVGSAMAALNPAASNLGR